MIDFPPPPAFGLPAAFAAWRPGQLDALLHTTDAPVRFPGLVLPTGAGKSLIYMAAATLTEGTTVILTATRALQHQLMHDFEALGAVLVQGQRGYPCTALNPGGQFHTQFHSSGWNRQTYTVEDGPCHAGIDCSLKSSGCSYYDTVRTAQRSRLIITNYAWWFSILANPMITIKPSLLVLDEAHAAPDALADALGATINLKEATDQLEQRIPTAHERTSEEWHYWAIDEAKKLEKRLDGARPSTSAGMRAVRRGQWLLRALTRIGDISPDLLIASDELGAVKFDVVWAAGYAESWLFRGVPRVVLTSATFTPFTAELLGVAPGEMKLLEDGQGFPVDRRPIYLVPVARVRHNWSASDQRTWLIAIDNVIRQRLDRKGILHSVSYAHRDYILAHSEFRDRMITHSRDNTAEMIAKFKASGPGTILVSPSVTTGYDFPYDECEYQLLVKVPFPDSRDPVTATRTLVNKRYPLYVAMQNLVQMVGRGMRASDDLCETICIDAQMSWFYWKNVDLAPKWFRRAVVAVHTLPAPPPPLRDAA